MSTRKRSPDDHSHSSLKKNKQITFNQSIADIFLNPDYRNIVNEIKPFIGTAGRRTFGLTSKSIYESIGGKTKADQDYAILKVNNDVDNILKNIKGKFNDYNAYQYALKFELVDLDFQYQIDDKLLMSEYLKQKYLDNQEFYKQSFQQ